MAEFGDLTPAQQEQLRAPFDQLRHALERQALIAVIRDKVRQFDNHGYQEAQRQMVTWSAAARRPAVYPTHEAGGNGAVAEPAAAAVPQYVSAQQLHVDFDKLMLADTQDVERYVAALKAALLAALAEGKHVQLG
jgi:hypothetical protein